MRIIGGRWRGRRLTPVGAGDAAAHLRPTTDRVREAIFNLLENAQGLEIDGLTVLDVFAGTGALGLEALSRGATSATFLETSRKARTILRQNIDLLNAPARLVPKDAMRPGPGRPHELIFLDPPYGKGLGERALAALLAQGWIAADATIVWEEAAPPNLPPGVSQTDQRRYGDTTITIAQAP
ncbi:MAG: 16S rRNA (guanine(966)-N(2))-methyltransferase RsmD [Pseudomonadota bacterium]